jgi:hypothetical protein
MTFSEIYNFLSFQKTKLITNKIIISTQNNLIIITCNAKQRKPQICVETIWILWFVMKKNIVVQWRKDKDNLTLFQ